MSGSEGLEVVRELSMVRSLVGWLGSFAAAGVVIGIHSIDDMQSGSGMNG